MDQYVVTHDSLSTIQQGQADVSLNAFGLTARDAALYADDLHRNGEAHAILPSSGAIVACIGSTAVPSENTHAA
jgi:hypothetical protein